MSLRASMPMYDLPEVYDDTNLLWRSIAGVLRSHGVDAPFELTRDMADLHKHWHDPALVFSHTCGYPAVSFLDGKVDIVGSWSTVVDSPGKPGWYRTVILARDDDQQADDLRAYARSGLRLCANGPESLSGWISLSQFLHDQPGLADDLLINEVPVVVTGAHFNSVAALRSGQADVASIDPWSYWLLSKWRTPMSMGLRVIGQGPEVSITPLMTSLGGPVDLLREALAVTAADPTMASARAALGITGFVPHGIEAHNPVRGIADRCEATIGLLRREAWQPDL